MKHYDTRPKSFEYNFDTLGFPSKISEFANRMDREYRENGKQIFVRAKFQQNTGLQLLKFNSGAIINTVIVIFKRIDFGKVDLKDVEVIIKTDTAPSYENFTKSKKKIERKFFDLTTQVDEFIDYIRPALWIDGNTKHKEEIFNCRLGIDRFETNPDYLTGAVIEQYEIIDQNTIELKLKGNNLSWYHRIDARKVTAFAMISDLAGMLLVISPDGGYKIVGRALEKRLNLI